MFQKPERETLRLLKGEMSRLRFFIVDSGIFLIEAFHASGGVDDLLFSSDKRMTLGTDFHLDDLLC